jgi:hypothetical protein
MDRLYLSGIPGSAKVAKVRIRLIDAPGLLFDLQVGNRKSDFRAYAVFGATAVE